jgi:hypothetical protein
MRPENRYRLRGDLDLQQLTKSSEIFAIQNLTQTIKQTETNLTRFQTTLDHLNINRDHISPEYITMATALIQEFFQRLAKYGK